MCCGYERNLTTKATSYFMNRNSIDISLFKTDLPNEI